MTLMERLQCDTRSYSSAAPIITMHKMALKSKKHLTLEMITYWKKKNKRSDKRKSNSWQRTLLVAHWLSSYPFYTLKECLSCQGPECSLLYARKLVWLKKICRVERVGGSLTASDPTGSFTDFKQYWGGRWRKEIFTLLLQMLGGHWHYPYSCLLPTHQDAREILLAPFFLSFSTRVKRSSIKLWER